MAETAEQAAMRAAEPLMGKIRRLAVRDRRALERVVATDENGDPRPEPRLRLVEPEGDE